MGGYHLLDSTSLPSGQVLLLGEVPLVVRGPVEKDLQQDVPITALDSGEHLNLVRGVISLRGAQREPRRKHANESGPTDTQDRSS